MIPVAPAIPEPDVIVLQPWLMDVISRSADPTLNASQRMELVNATVHHSILMEIQIKVVQLHLVVSQFNFIGSNHLFSGATGPAKTPLKIKERQEA